MCPLLRFENHWIKFYIKFRKVINESHNFQENVNVLVELSKFIRYFVWFSKFKKIAHTIIGIFFHTYCFNKLKFACLFFLFDVVNDDLVFRSKVAKFS